MSEITNGPFHVVLLSEDGGRTLSWKILDTDGRVHRAGASPMPDFAAGKGMIITIEFETDNAGKVARDLELLPVDRAAIEQRLGANFARLLVEESDGKEDKTRT